MANEQQAEFWSGSGGDYWVANQEAMDAMLAPLGEAALARLDLSKVTRVIDIGCGTGTTTLDIATRLPDGATVTGADLSVPMTDHARARGAAASRDNADFVTRDLQTAPFPANTFDAAFSRFGVMFFDDPVAGFTSLRQGMTPGAPLAFVCWQAAKDNPWHSLAVATARDFIDMPAPPPPRAPGPFAFAEPEYVTDILQKAGFRDIDMTPHEQTIQMFSGQDVPTAAANFARINPVISAFLREAGTDKADALIDAIANALAPYHVDMALHFPSATWLVKAAA